MICNIRKILKLTVLVLFSFSVGGVVSAEESPKPHIYTEGDLLVVVELSAVKISPREFLTVSIYATTSASRHIIFPEIFLFSDLTDPQIKDGYRAFSVFKSDDSAPTLNEDGMVVRTRKIVFAPGVAGKYIIPGFKVRAVAPDKESVVEVMPIEITVVSTLPTKQAQLKIKPIALLSDEKSYSKVWLYCAISLVIIMIMIVIKKMNKRDLPFDETEEIMEQFKRLQTLAPSETIARLETLMVTYYKLKYKLTKQVSGCNDLLYELEISGVASGELDSLRMLFKHYNFLRFSKDEISPEAAQRVCAEFADTIKSN